MHILFICSSLELGKDGVGDYTRRLAGELIRQGHRVSTVALYDKHIKSIQQEVQIDQNSEIDTLRLGSCISWSNKIKIAKKYVDNFNPEWISLQFVPYGFHNKGVPFCLGKLLLKIGSHRKWHIMFHELWIGYNKLNFKLRVISLLQKFIVKSLCVYLEPLCIHTSLPIYQEFLSQILIKSLPLPLFSNMPIGLACNVKKEKQGIYRIGFFSQFDFSFTIIEYLKTFNKLLKDEGRSLTVILIGGKGTQVELDAKKLINQIGEEIHVEITGFLEPKQVSNIILTLNAGMTPVPRHALGKSGSVATFLLHGIPVVAPYVMRGYSNQEVGFFYDSIKEIILDNLDIASLIKKRVEIPLSISSTFEVSSVAKKFKEDIVNCT